MMHTTHRIFYLCPKSFDAVCVGISKGKRAFTVRNAQMVETALCQPVIHRIFVCVNSSIKRNGIVNKRYQSVGLRIRHNFGLYFPFALHSTYNGCLPRRATRAFALTDTPPNISLVNLNVATIVSE